MSAGAPDRAAFLRALRVATGASPREVTAAAVAAVLPFQRAARLAPTQVRASGDPEDPRSAAAPGDLDRLPGAGPGLVWALEQAGIARLADLAACAPAPLADRLGPLGGLVDLPDWIAFARHATGAATGEGDPVGPA